MRAGMLAAMLLAAPAWARLDVTPFSQAPPGDPPRAMPGFDAATGRDLRTYPPHPVVEYRHMSLRIDIPDMNVPRLAAVQSLQIRPVGAPVSVLALDAKLLEVQSVACAGHATRFENDGRRLTVHFEPPLSDAAEVITSYSVVDPPAGLNWTLDVPEWAGGAGRPAQIHTQGESADNCYWFPCHDFPNVRLTTELIVTVPAGFLVSANGRMASPVQRAGNRETFHWIQDKPHVNYLVSMVVGKFDVVDVGSRGLAMPVYVPPGRGPDVKATYGRTPRMVELFARLTGQPYPWDRYAQLTVWNFGPGGMENTSATTLYDTAILSPRAVADGIDLDGLISHELAHQWFGDLITCNSWEHIWLNEGFATYFSSLWAEKRDGDAAYQAGILGNFDSVTGGDRADAPYQRAMVSKVYREPDEMFGGAAGPYPKGAAILHMLRMRLGDEVFFKGLAAFVSRFKFRTAETHDFRRVLEDVSGEGLDRFFRQWCERPGVPDLDVDLSWDAAAHELVVSVKQTQNIDGDNPAFAFELPIWVEGARPASGRRSTDAAEAIGSIMCQEREATGRFRLAAEPAFVAVDPQLSVLARFTIRQSESRWRAQLARGPTWAARVQACRSLRAGEAVESVADLSRLARSDKADARLRAEAVRSLVARRESAAVVEVGSKSGLPAEVESVLIEAVGSFAEDARTDGTVRARLIEFVAGRAGPSGRQQVRAEAVRMLGRLKLADRLPVVLAAAGSESQDDRVRQAALDALGWLDAPEGLPVAIRCTGPAMLNRTRPVAINRLATLAHYDREAAFQALLGAVRAREAGVWNAAGTALVGLKDHRAIDALRAVLATKRGDDNRRIVQGWIDSLEAKAAAAP